MESSIVRHESLIDVQVWMDPKVEWSFKGESYGQGLWRVHCVGTIIVGNQRLSGAQAAGHLIKLFADVRALEENFFKEKLAALQGHFAFILDGPSFTLAVVDKIRSYPVFYSQRSQKVYLSNSTAVLKSNLQLNAPDPFSILEFEMAGYVTANRTLYENLFALQAGEYFLIDKERGKLCRVDYYLFQPQQLALHGQAEWLEKLDEVSLRAFKRLVESLDGRPAWVPLSGGLDSRWIVTMLQRLKYDNIVTFSYGKPGHPEVERAEIIARKLKVRWFPVVYRRPEIQSLYYSTERKQYSDFADGLCSIPVFNDYYALWLMRRDKKIPPEAILINGQTGDFLTGGHIPKNILKGEEFSADFLANEIIQKHFSLWLDVMNQSNCRRIAQTVLKELNVSKDRLYSREETAANFELWEWRERQAKFVVNGQRVYEWFGYDWRLPLWDDELMTFWQNVPWDLRFGQSLQKAYLNKNNFGGVFNGFYMGPHPLKWWERLATWGIVLYSRLARKNAEQLVRKYLWYFTNYAPFYISRSYREYLKNSGWHRNVYSFLVRDYLKSLSLKTPSAL